jgi:acetate kinase
MTAAILVLNAGSSSIKFSLYHAGESLREGRFLYHGEFEGLGHKVHFEAQDVAGALVVDRLIEGPATHQRALSVLLEWLNQQSNAMDLVAAGHRVVHGGRKFFAPVVVTTKIIQDLKELATLAPQHQLHNLAAITALSELHPRLPQVACFDTSFHRTQPAVATAFALPRALTASGIKRYGFHGLSYEYIASVLHLHLGAEADGRVVVAHLGNGASMCAMANRQSVATTMGFSALDGLVMGRRCGTLDPGVILYLLDARAMTARAISNLLYEESGLLGVSGISDDMRDLLASSDPRAAEAVALFVYRISRELGSLVAALGGLDALVFTGGIGEHAAEIRRRVCENARWLGIALDGEANQAGGPCITQDDSHPSAWVIPTNEDLMIARHTSRLLT